MSNIPGEYNINCVLHNDAASAFQGNTGTKAPSLDVMMLKQQFFSTSRARCYPFNMDHHLFHDKSVKMCPYNQHS